MPRLHFCFWLQGYLELTGQPDTSSHRKPDLTPMQLECVKAHLALVFRHDIDPSMGPPAHQQELDSIHAGVSPNVPPRVTLGGPPGPHGELMRC